MDYYIGIDIGTTAIKAVIVDNLGEIMVKSNIEYSMFFPHKGWAEQDAAELWESVKLAVKEAVSAFPYDKRCIRALSLSTQRDTMVCVDKNNKPLRNAITWMDSRSESQCEQLRRDIGEDKVYDITGVGISTIWTFSFILWLKENEPSVFENTHCFSLIHDFVLSNFGATEHFLDYSNACQSMLFDYKECIWSPVLMEYAKLDIAKLPKLVPSGQKVGTMSSNIAEELGLSQLDLISGGGDQQMASFGAGAIKHSQVEIGIGTAANMLVTIDYPLSDDNRRLICHRGVLPQKWVLEGAMLSTGRVVEWLKNEVYFGTSLQDIDADVNQNSIPGAGGLIVIPHFEGAACPYWKSYTRGTVAGFSLSTKRCDIARAIYEGIAFEIKKNIELLETWEITPEHIIISGGAAKSAVWMQILADITGIKVLIPKQIDCAALGAAILAGFGSGKFESLENTALNLVKYASEYLPNKELKQMYADAYKKNKMLYNSLDSSGYYEKMRL